MSNDRRKLEGGRGNRAVAGSCGRWVDTKNLDPIDLGRSAQLCLGDGIIALGFRSGCEATVTHVIVSGQGRSIEPEASPLLEGVVAD